MDLQANAHAEDEAADAVLMLAGPVVEELQGALAALPALDARDPAHAARRVSCYRAHTSAAAHLCAHARQLRTAACLPWAGFSQIHNACASAPAGVWSAQTRMF